MFRLVIAIVLAAVATASHAANPFVQAHAGTLGLGFEGGMDFGKLRLRAQTNDYSYEHSDSYDGVDYEVTLDLSSTGVVVDFMPLGKMFYLSAGLFDNGNSISGASEQSDVQVGDSVVSGRVITDVTFDSEALYAGAGLRFGGSSGFGVNLDVGAFMNGSPDVSLTTTNESFNESNRDDIAKEEQAIEDDLEGFELMPVVKLGVAWYF